jgi:hypothetical protein
MTAEIKRIGMLNVNSQKPKFKLSLWLVKSTQAAQDTHH